MVAATAAMWKTTGDSRGARNERARMLKRRKQFQFMFAVATSHELCHAFSGYLSQNGQDIRSYTPPTVSHLNFAGYDPDGIADQGESGRWFENHLFGGSLEFYRDFNDDHGQVSG